MRPFLPALIRKFLLAVLLGLLASLSAQAQTVFASGAGITAYDASTGVARNFNSGEGLLTVSPDGARLYASTIFGLNVIDTATGQVIANIAAGIRPQDYAISSDGKRLYIANFGEQTMYIADAVTNTVIKSLPVPAPLRVAVSPDNSRVYVSTTSGGVLILDPATDTVIGSIPGTASGSAFGPFFGGITFSVDSQRAYIAFNNGFWIVDAQKDTLLQNVTIPAATGIIQQVVPTIDGSRLYAAADRTSPTQGPQAVYVLDALTLSVTNQIPVGECSPQIALSADGTKLFVSDIDAAMLDTIDVSTNSITASVPIGGPGSISGVATVPPPPAQAKRLSVPASLAFESIVQGGTANGSLALTNTGSLPLTITAISSDNAAFSLVDPAAVPVTIQPGSTVIVVLLFRPSSPGAYSGVLSISVQDLSPLLQVNLTGISLAPALLVVQPPSLDFGRTSTAEVRTLPITVSNTGGSVLIGHASITATSTQAFSLSGDGAFSVPPGGSATVSVSFSPHDRLQYSGTLSLVSNGGTIDVALAGSGEQLAVLLVVGFNGDSMTFGLMGDFIASDNKNLKVFSFNSPTKGILDDSPVSCHPTDFPVIERVAGELAACIADIKNLGFDRVDVVSHSMGGLVTRAYIAGLAQQPGPVPSVPYRADIRKLIMVGTPHYGIPRDLTGLLGLIFTKPIQVEEMIFGSDFLLRLDQKWRDVVIPENRIEESDMLTIVGTQSIDGSAVIDDGLVPSASATLPCEFLSCDGTIRQAHVRYVPYQHADLSSLPIPLPPSFTGPAEVHVDSADSQTLKLVEDFILERPLRVLFTPPSEYTTNGLLLLHFVDSNTGNPVGGATVALGVSIDGVRPLLGNINVRAGTVTSWPLTAGQHQVSITLLTGRYQTPDPFTVTINGGRPTVRIVQLQQR